MTCLTLAEKRIKQLFLKFDIDLSKSRAIDVWEITKIFCKETIKPNISIENGEKCLSSYLFECGLSEEDNLYYFILTRRFSNFSCFVLTEEKFFHFIFAYKPLTEYASFKGQLSREGLMSTDEFFKQIEEKEIFKRYMYETKPLNIKYLLDNKQFTTFM